MPLKFNPFNKNRNSSPVLPVPFQPAPANPRISLEFLPNGQVQPIVFWEPHTNFDVKLMANVMNLMNEGKLFEAFQEAVIVRGTISGDVELATALLRQLSDPKSIEDEEPAIPADQVTRHHFTQNRINMGDE